MRRLLFALLSILTVDSALAQSAAQNLANFASYLQANSNGNILLGPPVSSTALTVSGVPGQYAAVFNGANAAGSSALDLVGSFSGSGNTNLLQLTDTGNTNGVNLKMIGNGGGNASKTLRVNGGAFQIINAGYTATLLSLTDGGGLTVLGNGANGSLAVAANSTFTSQLTVQANGNGAGAGLLLQQDTAHNGYFRNQDTGSLFLGVGGTNYIQMNASGDVTHSAPTGGTALTINAQGTANAQLWGSVNNTTNGNLTLNFDVNGNAFLYNQIATGLNLGTTQSSGVNLVTNNSTRVNVQGTGDVLINAPASGNALTVNGFSGSVPLVVSTGGSSDAAVQVSGGSAGFIGSILFLANGGTQTGRVAGIGTANQLITGTAAGDFVVQQIGTGTFRVITNGVDRFDITSTGVLIMDTGFTVATLPACGASLKGGMTYVTDATTPGYNGVLTGGSNVIVPVFCNGTAWSSH